MILITHSHRDHFDRTFLSALPDKGVAVVVPTALANSVRELGFSRVVVLDAWQAAELLSLRVTAVPAVHLGPTNAYLIQSAGAVVYFAAETVFFGGLADIADGSPGSMSPCSPRTV